MAPTHNGLFPQKKAVNPFFVVALATLQHEQGILIFQ
jgi:hypothetical protein